MKSMIAVLKTKKHGIVKFSKFRDENKTNEKVDEAEINVIKTVTKENNKRYCCF